MKKVKVGIDLGTTNTLVCCRVKGKLQLLKFPGGQLLPSVVYIEKQEDGTIKEYVGSIAKKKGDGDPNNCIRSSKTYIGKTGKEKKEWVCYGKTYTSTDIATLILKEVHKKVRDKLNLEEEDIVQAVITIPAYFSSNQSDETKRAGERAGLQVLRIVTEPVAAAIAAADDLNMEGKFFVVDLGGGTFDVSVLQVNGQKFHTLTIDGERNLGGDDFDRLLMGYFLEYIQEDLSLDLSSQENSGLSYENYNTMMGSIRKAAIEMKEELSSEDEYEVHIPNLFTYGNNQRYDFDISMTRKEFNELCSSLFERIMKVIKNVAENADGFDKRELEQIFLVGGSCYIPKVQEDVETYFGMSTNSEQDRSTQVAIGAGKIADSWDGLTTDEGRVDPFEVVDIISHAMGIECVTDRYESAFSELLKKSDPYPCQRSDVFTTTWDNQDSVIINVYEKIDENASEEIGEDNDHYDLYGSFVLEGIEKAPAGQPQIKVTFEYDESRTLQVTAEDLKTNAFKRVSLHKGERIQEEKHIEPMDFILLVDVSGSMMGTPLNDAKKACKKMINEIVDLNMHRLGLITFGSYIQVECELMQNKTQLCDAVDRFYATGGTDMTGGIETAINAFTGSINQKAVILITDGEPNQMSSTRSAATEAKRKGIKIATIGVESSNIEFLKEIADNPSLCFKIKDMSKLAEAFDTAVKNLLKK